MNRDEFIKICQQSGYACKRVAEEYCKDKKELNEDDLREVWLINQRRLAIQNNEHDKRLRYFEGCKTTKKFKGEGHI